VRRIILGITLVFCSSSLSAQKSTKPVWPDEGPRTWAPRPTVTAITANDLPAFVAAFHADRARVLE